MKTLHVVQGAMLPGVPRAVSQDQTARARVLADRDEAHVIARNWPEMRCRTYERVVRAGGVNITVYVVVATPALVKKGYAP